jgi:multiple sugar transport system ATP-binding protein
MTMGDRVAVMRKGELQQVDSPQELYDRPVNIFVGGFIGSPSMNMLEATVQRNGNGMVATFGSQQLTLGDELLQARSGLAGYEGQQVIIGIRPEDLEDASIASDTPPERRIKGTVGLREALGSEIMVHLDVDAPRAQTDEVRELAEDVGAEALHGNGGEHSTVVGRFSSRSRVKTGEPIEVAVETRSLHFFDPQTGLGIYAEAAKGAPTS